MLIRKNRALLSTSEIERMDKALALVGGSFVAAAKLVDMTPQKFRNAVHAHVRLKTKWGSTKRGRPANSPDFRIDPFDEIENSIGYLQVVILELSLEDRRELVAWLKGHCGEDSNAALVARGVSLEAPAAA